MIGPLFITHISEGEGKETRGQSRKRAQGQKSHIQLGENNKAHVIAAVKGIHIKGREKEKEVWKNLE